MASPLTEPTAPRSPDQLLAEVYRRAPRLRRRRRIARGSVGLAVVAVAAIVGLTVFGGGAPESTQVVTEPDTTVPPVPDAPLAVAADGSPAEFVIVDASGVSVDDATSGAAIRTLVPVDITTPTTSSLGSGTIAPASVAVSPDRTEVSYVGTDGEGRRSVFVVPAAGGSTRKVFDLPSPSPYANYAISPDRTRIAWFRDPGAAGADLVITDLASGDESTLATGLEPLQMDPVWSPDGRSLAITSWASKTDLQVQVIRVDQSHPYAPPRSLSAPGGCQYRRPAYVGPAGDLAVLESCASPGAAFLAGGRVVIVDPDTGHELRSVLSVPTNTRISGYSFDRTGQHLLYVLDEFFEGRTDAWTSSVQRFDGAASTRIPAQPGLIPEIAW